MKKPLLLIIATLLTISTGCVRYTPSQREILDSRKTTETNDGQEIVTDKAAFFEFETAQQDRLQSLVTTRRANASGSDSTYRIGAGDVIEFNVFDVEEFKDTVVRVRPSGFISLPLLGAVQVTGKTEGEIQDEVTKKLSTFIRSPQVNVFIQEYSANKVNVIGEVAKPGSYVLKRNDYSLIELLSEAGGRKETASGRIVLIPAPETQPATDARAALGDPATLVRNDAANGIEIYFDDLVGSVKKAPLSIPLRAGDTIVVPESGEIQIDGEVKRPGSVKLSSRTSLLGAIAAAGGLTYAAKVNEVEVIRELDSGKKALLSVDLENLALAEGRDVRLRDGDVVRVPSESGRFATRQVVDVLNRIVNFGLSGSVNVGP